MESKVKYFSVDVAKTWKCSGAPEYVDSVMQLGVLEPIILNKVDGELKILAGQRRVASYLKAHEILAEGGSEVPERLKSIKAVVYENLPKIDAEAITIAENEQRSANPVATWKAIQEASKRGDYDAVVALSKINKARLKAIQRLNQVRSALIDAYDEGKISEGTLLATSSLGSARQDYLLEKLRTQKRITMGDVKEAKKARTAAVLAARPMITAIPSVGTQPVQESKFIVLVPDAAGNPKFLNFHDAMEEKCKIDGSEIWRVIKIT